MHKPSLFRSDGNKNLKNYTQHGYNIAIYQHGAAMCKFTVSWQRRRQMRNCAGSNASQNIQMH